MCQNHALIAIPLMLTMENCLAAAPAAKPSHNDKLSHCPVSYTKTRDPNARMQDELDLGELGVTI